MTIRRNLCLSVASGLYLSAAALAGQASPFGGQTVNTETMHLSVAASIADVPAASGKRVSLAFNVMPKKDMHVYAPGKHDYQVIAITVDAQPWLKAQPAAYPPSEIHDFVELNEKVEVYSKPFKLVRDVTILTSVEAKKALASTPSPFITGNLEYQACDDKVCYAPKKVPFKFAVEMKPKS